MFCKMSLIAIPSRFSMIAMVIMQGHTGKNVLVCSSLISKVNEIKLCLANSGKNATGFINPVS